MTFDFEETLRTIEERQWALADIDWDAPGKERITAEQWPKLKTFMSDLVWIENVGARGFAALAKKAPTPTLAAIYRYFHAEEQRHANAELALMRRWGMLEDGEIPEPDINIRLGIEWLDRYADDMPLAGLGTVIPMLEVALDGALLKFLLDEVDDPVCHEVFRKINADESRHLAVDFQVLDMLGCAPASRILIDALGTLRPTTLLGVLAYVPLLNRMRDKVIAMGLSEQRLYDALGRFGSIGGRSENTRRLPSYHVIRSHAAIVVNRRHPYHVVADAMAKVTAAIPQRALGPVASWANELTYQPVHS